MEEVEMVMVVAEEFNLEKAVCNHGFFMMAPNKWIPSHKSLIRPLSVTDDDNNKSAFTVVSITQPPNKNYILITPLLKHPPQLLLSSHHQHSIRCQVARMLHISSEDETMVHDFHKLHPMAKKSGFARIFRSPTLFEDIIKSILLCCCPWARSLEMAEALCNLEYKLCDEKKGRRGCKRKRCSSCINGGDEKDWWWSSAHECMGNFPTPKEIACLDEDTLNKHCNLGYRASTILEFSRNILSGSLDLDDLATSSHHKFLRNRLTRIRGFGPFTIANIMMCIGFYQNIPVDTETIKHLQQVHGKTKLNCRKSERDAIIGQIYDKYAPFQCLVYWMERVEYYEKNLGKLSELPHSKYRNVASSNFALHTSENKD